TYDTRSNSNDFYSSSVIKDDILFSTTSSGELYALDVEDGQLLWNVSIGNQPTVPAIYDDKLFIGTTEGLKMLDIGWMIQGGKPLGKIVSRPVVANNRVIVGAENGNIYAFDAESGDEQWNAKLPDEIYISQPWNGSLFIGSGDKCYKINIENGDISWIFETDGMITSRPYVQDDVMYFGSWDTFVYAVNTETGNLKWKFETGWGVETTPIVDDGLVFVGSHDNDFYALHGNNGTMCWAFTCKSGIHSSPAVSDNYVIFGSDDGRLYCLDKLNGNFIWNFSPGYTIDDKINYLTTPIISDPIIDGETVFIGVNGNIYALSL
ncbi:MAG: PQQ-binding-like beta-propeller repeat protein, partial [Thermoplasmatales archaeon]|nr:PQQ-binding-like beta-propeller repeat protein [Thermoplasmatales archaeon]